MKIAGFLLATIPLWDAGSLEYTAASAGAQEIDGYLQRKQSPMAGLGTALSDYSRQYIVDPRLVIAISGAETTFGRHLCADNNAWNWFHHRNCAQSPFENYPQGAERVTRFMRSSYLNRGYTTIELIRYKYCTSGCDNWISMVNAFHDEMPESRTPAVTAAPQAAVMTSQTAKFRKLAMGVIGDYLPLPGRTVPRDCASTTAFWRPALDQNRPDRRS